MCTHCILPTACPQALGSLRFISTNLQLQHFKDLKPCCHWCACEHTSLLLLQERVWESFPRAQISLSNPYKSSSCCRGQLQAQLLGGIEINASCWEGGSACEQPRGELLQGSVGPAGFDSSAREAAAWKLRAGTIQISITHSHAAPWIKAAGESNSSL